MFCLFYIYCITNIYFIFTGNSCFKERRENSPEYLQCHHAHLSYSAFLSRPKGKNNISIKFFLPARLILAYMAGPEVGTVYPSMKVCTIFKFPTLNDFFLNFLIFNFYPHSYYSCRIISQKVRFCLYTNPFNWLLALHSVDAKKITHLLILQLHSSYFLPLQNSSVYDTPPSRHSTVYHTPMNFIIIY